MIQKIKNILQKRWVVVISALILIAQSIYEIYQDFFNMAHQHILISMGLLMIINEIRGFYLGSHSLLDRTKNTRINTFFRKSDKILSRNNINFIFGFIILVTSCYSLFLDAEGMYARTYGAVLGSIMCLLALRQIVLGGAKINHSFKQKESL